jgi:hypothetical protein
MSKGNTALMGCAGLIFAIVAPLHAAPLAPTTAVKHATDHERFGLFSSEDFQETIGSCTDCASLKQGLWYFRDEVLAVPKANSPLAGYSRTAENLQDIRQWAAGTEAQTLAYPPLIWLGAPHVADSVTLTADGKQIKTVDGSLLNFQLVPKIADNRSYFDASSAAFFGPRQLRMRGTMAQVDGAPTFIARTIWPKDFVIDQSKLVNTPLGEKESLTSFVQADGGGAKSQFATRLIWERHPGQSRQWQDKGVIGIMLNGAQGDDDEAYGGHFAIVTGKYGPDGDWSNWMVNDFYNLDSFSEKGIIAAMVPMDNYLMDLNSGQQYYRPSYMLVAILNNPRTAELFQGGVERTYNHFYRHDFTYQHAAANCAGISLDVFKALGWNIPERGPTGRLKAIAAYGYLSAKDGSLSSGRKIYDYLSEEQTHLLPAVAFDAAGQDLLKLASTEKASRELSDFEKHLQSDVDALVLVRIPQIPSSRAFGSNPVFSFDEYMRRAPADHAKWKIVPVGARPFPHELRDGLALDEHAEASMPWPIVVILIGMAFGIGALVRRRKRKETVIA